MIVSATMAASLPQESQADPAREPVPASTVREQLARVVNSPGFVSSARLTRFLTHIVNRTLNGDLDSLKEFSIAMEVFDRTADYDPNIDAIVMSLTTIVTCRGSPSQIQDESILRGRAR